MPDNFAPAENRMGTMPVGKLLFTLSFPMMVSMLVQALYNIVDSIYVSRICEDALTAVSVAFPIQNLMISLAVGIGVGMNALLSRNLGEKNFKGADRAAVNGLFLYVFVYAVFLIIGLFFITPFYLSQTDIPEIIGYGEDYLFIVTVFSFGCLIEIAFERLLLSTGKTFYAMLSQGTGAVVNIILDPIFIFTFKLGVKGAAIATIIGQLVGASAAVFFNLRFNKEIHLSFRGFRPSGHTVASILKVGIPSALMGSVGSIMNYCMNRILIDFTSTATAVFGVYFKLQSFVFMPVFGLNNGMVPIIAYNYGAKRPDRLVSTIKLSVIAAFCIMLAGFAAFQLLPTQLLGFFKASDSMLQIGVPALRIISISFLLAGYCVVISSVFQAFGKGVSSMLVSLIRQLFVLLPSAYLLSHFGGLDAVWWSFPIAEIASVTVCTVLFILLYRNYISPMKADVASEQELSVKD